MGPGESCPALGVEKGRAVGRRGDRVLGGLSEGVR